MSQEPSDGRRHASATASTLLFDLDDTLVVEEQAAKAAFEETARFAAAQTEVEAATLAATARSRARDLWYAAPTHGYCMRIGISSWEGLWCRFEGDDPDSRALREWSPTYRRETWRLALADSGIDDLGLAEELGERFATERRGRHHVFNDVLPILAELKRSYATALLTNGAACLQREKLVASGLSGFFDVVVISSEFGVAKPDPAIFGHALAQLEADGRSAVMIGDSLPRDVDGAIAAGLAGIWLNRAGRPRPPDRAEVIEVSTLRDLPQALIGLASRDDPAPTRS